MEEPYSLNLLCFFHIKAKLEMNKETIAEELVCLLDVASRPQDVAGLKAKIASFFIVASVRIDLIAKIMDLDNDIGTYNFDIPLLDKTRREIKSIAQSPGMTTSYLKIKVRRPTTASQMIPRPQMIPHRK